MNYLNLLDQDIILKIIKDLYSLELKNISTTNIELNRLIKNNWEIDEFNIYLNDSIINNSQFYKIIKIKGIIYNLKLNSDSTFRLNYINSNLYDKNCYYFELINLLNSNERIDNLFIKINIRYPKYYNKDIKLLNYKIIYNFNSY